jgi:hypothetical protein
MVILPGELVSSIAILAPARRRARLGVFPVLPSSTDQ